jgi:two-component system, NtrC family, sensor kinase
MDSTAQRGALEVEKPQSSVSRRVLAAFAVVIVSFTALLAGGIVLYRQTVAELSLINSAYLPLTMGTSDIRSTQLVFNTLMDRLADAPAEHAARAWIDAARRFRPVTLRKLATLAKRTAARAELPEDERAFLVEMGRRLREVEKRYRENEVKFLQAYAEMDAGHAAEAVTRIEDLKRAERLLDSVLGGIEGELKRHITQLTESAVRDGTRAALGLAVMTIVALLVGAAVIFSVRRSLAPLRKLQAAVSDVAKGDLRTQIEISQQDEIGALAKAFNRMTLALADRGERLVRSERLATAGKMAAQVTHEIRNPLSSLGLNAELLEDELAGVPDRPEARALLRAMQDEIERLTGITESYLRFARLPAPELELADLNQTVEAALEFMRSELAEARIDAVSRLAADLRPVLLDRGQIRQALLNLLRNAREAMPEGGRIEIATRSDERGVVLEVADDGPGIPSDVAAQIFDSFYTTKSGGTGLGLSLVRQICLAHGGDVRYEENPGGGSRFAITLPGAGRPAEPE